MFARSRAVLATTVGVAVVAAGLLGRGLTATEKAPTNGIARVLAASRELGATDGRTRLALNLGIRGRDSGGLDQLLARGGRVSATEYAARFGPDPSGVAVLLGDLRAQGIGASWSPGSPIVAVDGDAATISRLFQVSFHDYLGEDGHRFLSADSDPTYPAWMSSLVKSIDGLDTFTVPHSNAVPSNHGITPDNMRGFYNFAALRKAGVDGSGETIILPDAAPPRLESDLSAYASKYHLPPFNVEVKGTRGDDELGEVDLDAQIVHGMAPGAKILIYVEKEKGVKITSRLQDFVRVRDQIVTENAAPVVSDSHGWCEQDWQDLGIATQMDDILKRGAAQGQTWLVSSGDEGAYGCFRKDEDQRRVANAMPSSDPWVTSVGGTTVFLSSDPNAYFKETSWGNPLSEAGSGGGPTGIFERPSWQQGAGVENADSNGKRQTPDVAALADSATGWDLVVGGKEAVIGGTSAAAPLWGAFIVMLNQDLVAKGLRRAGFGNPAIYGIAARPEYPGPPLHDIVEGNNLHFAAAPGWDYATGWGTPNCGALASAWEAYIGSGGK